MPLPDKGIVLYEGRRFFVKGGHWVYKEREKRASIDVFQIYVAWLQ